MVKITILQWANLCASMVLTGHQSLTHAYDIGCLYPSDMPEPFAARGANAIMNNNLIMTAQFETPVVVHVAHTLAYCQPNCVAYHDDKSLNAITKSRPPFSTPVDYFNSWSRVMCIIQCYSMGMQNFHKGSSRVLDPLFSSWGLDIFPANNDILDCNNESTCIHTVVQNGDYDPRLIGQVVWFEIAAHLEEDGWNSSGNNVYDPETDSAVPCTTNCIQYTDTTGYFPRNHPGAKRGKQHLTSKRGGRQLKKSTKSKSKTEKQLKTKSGTNQIDKSNKSKSKTEKSGNKQPKIKSVKKQPKMKSGKKQVNTSNESKFQSEEKYEVKGNDKLWQPLLESAGPGNFNRQDHVTPHIGYTVKPVLIQEFQEAENPNYNYKVEADLVVKRLKELVGDESRIAMLREFDNKLITRAIIAFSFRQQFSSSYTFEDYVMFVIGISSVEHDAVIQCWREKVRFDGVRPTTVIQRWNDDVINTYNGDPTSTEPKEIKARDFQSFIRVMPHSEYPSGSASICAAYADFTDHYTKEYFGGKTLNLVPVGEGGLSFGCDSPSPFKLGCGGRYHVHNMTELAEMCAESRLWGGMHFTKSIEAGKEIMSGIGELGLNFVKTIRNGSDWSNSYKRGDPRPVCGDAK